MTSAHQKLLLSSLCYSSLDKLDISSTKDYRNVVTWLEHTKVIIPLALVAGIAI